MSMPNPDELEDSIRRQPARSLPGAWRREILRAARRAGSHAVADSNRAAQGPVPGLTTRLRDWLWPHPVAWATLAALWIVIASLRLTDTQQVAMPDFPPPPTEEEFRPILAQHRQLWTEFAAALEKASHATRKPQGSPPEPRSQSVPDHRKG